MEIGIPFTSWFVSARFKSPSIMIVCSRNKSNFAPPAWMLYLGVAKCLWLWGFEDDAYAGSWSIGLGPVCWFTRFA